MNRYFQELVGQDVKRNMIACFIMTDSETEAIQGFYTLSNNSIPPEHFVGAIPKKKLPRYPLIPTTLIGRLAIDKAYQGQNFGKILLVDALKRCYEISQKEIGSFAVVVDPIDEAAESFYRKFGFTLLDSGKMFIDMIALQASFG